MTITPVVPCYIKSTGCIRWKSLEVGSSTQIKPGDVCSLLPNRCWFKIISVPDIMEESQTLKRKVGEDLNNETDGKKICISPSVETVVSPSETLKDILNDRDLPTKDHNLSNNENKKHNDVPVLQEIYLASSLEGSEVPTTSSKISTDTQDIAEPLVQINGKRKAGNINLTSDIVDAKLEKKTKWDRDAHSDQVEAASLVQKSSCLSGATRQKDRTPSADRVPRDKCVYGSRCYRKNHNHRNNYSHPGDRDYDEVDDREECPYGAKCYRKNLQHKAQFKHTIIPRQRRKATAFVAGNTDRQLDENSSTEESVDESDYQPSDYMESSDDWEEDSGSEWEDGTTG